MTASRPDAPSRAASVRRVRPALAGLAALAMVATLAACGAGREPNQTPEQSAAAAAPSTPDTTAMSPQPGAGDWRLLFDGRTTAGWRGYRRQDVPDGWQVVDGALTRVGGGGDLITVDQFANFELELDWMVQPGGNSGVMYRVTEEGENTYFTGPEMQVLDDARHADGRSRLTAAGAAYGLYPSPEGVVKPAGEWNHARLVVNGDHVEHWLNGQKVVEYELGSPDWRQRVANSKFVEWPGYGRAARGHIALQDHGDRVAFRDIRVRELP
jgi:hypothetical protein